MKDKTFQIIAFFTSENWWNFNTSHTKKKISKKNFSCRDDHDFEWTQLTKKKIFNYWCWWSMPKKEVIMCLKKESLLGTWWNSFMSAKFLHAVCAIDVLLLRQWKLDYDKIFIPEVDFPCSSGRQTQNDWKKFVLWHMTISLCFNRVLNILLLTKPHVGHSLTEKYEKCHKIQNFCIHHHDDVSHGFIYSVFA